MRKILIISTVLTPPVKSGCQKCILEYSEIFKKFNSDLYFLFISGWKKNDEEDYFQCKKFWGDHFYDYKKKNLMRLISRLFSFIYVYFFKHNRIDDMYPFGVEKKVKEIIKKQNIDLVIVNYIELSRLFLYLNDVKKVIFTHDVFSNKKEILGIKKVRYNLSPTQERLGLKRADIILAIQENEATYFSYLVPNVLVYTVFTPFRVCRIPLTYNKNILFFSGKSDLNYNGLKSFVMNVFPLILAKVADAQLLVGGEICDREDLFIETSNVKRIGRIDNEKDFYEMGDICINPVYQGTGLKIKTFEALSYGRIVVTNPHSLNGIFRPNDAPLFIANSAEDFALTIIDLLYKQEMRKVISDASCKYIEDMNSYIYEQYEKVLNN